jgi:hypothetical protein
MAVSMDALLKIKADVSGEGAVQNLARGIGNLNRQAGDASKGFRGLLGAAGGVSGALSALIPLASGAGLFMLAKGAIDAADGMRDLSIKTGVSVPQLSQFAIAAKQGGTNIESIGKALFRLSRGIGSTMVDATDQVEEEMGKQVTAIKDGEQKQLDAVEASAEKKLRALEGESDKRFTELNRRYRQEQKLIDDQYTDAEDRQDEAAQKEENSLERSIQRKYDIQIQAIRDNDALTEQQKDQTIQQLQDQRDEELDVLRGRFREAAKLRQRAFRDEKEDTMIALEERKATEEKAIRTKLESQQAIVRQNADAQKKSITDLADHAVKELKRGFETGNVQQGLRELGLSSKDAAGNTIPLGEQFLRIVEKLSAIPDAQRRASIAYKIFAKDAAALMPLLAGGRKEIEKIAPTMSTKFANAADKLNDKLPVLEGKIQALAIKLATALMPALEGITNAVVPLLDAFNKMPAPLQNIVGGVAVLAGAVAVLGPALAGIAAFTAIPLVANILNAFAGLIAFFVLDFLPVLLGVFTGPAGWITLAVIAVVAMCIAFREPIGKFLAWFGETWMKGLTTVAGFLKLLFIDPWIGLWNNVLRAPVTALWSWLQETTKWWLGALYAIAWQLWVQPWINLWNTVLRQPVTAAFGWLQSTWKQVSSFFLNGVVKPISSAWTALMTTISNAMRTAAGAVTSVWNTVLGTVKNVIRSFLQGWANAINSVIAQVNRLIQTFNLLPGPDIGTLGTVSVPAFAQGGVVTRPTVGLVGEAGPEYIIPASKMAAASQRFLGGARGDAVLNGRAASTAPAQINITTGPVVEMNGQRYVSIADLELAMRITADSVMGQLRTPSARIALGLA